MRDKLRDKLAYETLVIGLATLTLMACGMSKKSPTNTENAKFGLDGDFGSEKTMDNPPFYEDNPTYVSDKVVDWQVSTPEAQKVDPALLDAAATQVGSLAQNFSFLVIRNGKLIKESYFNGSAANQSNNIHSASKGMIGALVGIAIDEGVIQGVNGRLVDVLPRKKITDATKKTITTQDLLTMSGGWKWTEDSTEYTIQDSKDWSQAILDLPLKGQPGKKFNYCTGQTHLLSTVLTEMTGGSTSAYATEKLFGPLGIGFEHWGQDPQGVNSGGYNLYMTPRALARFAWMMAEGGEFAGKQIVPESWVATSWESAQKVDNQYTYGYLWWLINIGGHDVKKLWGYGGQFALVIPDFNALVVITANTARDFSEMDADQFLADYIMPAMH